MVNSPNHNNTNNNNNNNNNNPNSNENVNEINEIPLNKEENEPNPNPNPNSKEEEEEHEEAQVEIIEDEEEILMKEANLINNIYLYKWVDVQDYLTKWYEGQVIEINKIEEKIKIHYKGWKEKFDEWIDIKKDYHRIQPLHTYTHCPKSMNLNIELNKGIKLDVLDQTDQWYEGIIIEINYEYHLIKIHYLQWSDKFDEWLNDDSYRLAPLGFKTKPSSSSSSNSVSKK